MSFYEDARERIAEWLRANGINPDDVPLHQTIVIATRSDGARVIRYAASVPGSVGLIREDREVPLTAEFDGGPQ